MSEKPAAIQRAERQLEMILNEGSLTAISEELALCWTGLKADPAVAEPATKMGELGDWFTGQIKVAISREIAQNPVGMVPDADDFWAESEERHPPPLEHPPPNL